MAKPTQKAIVKALIARHGQSYSDELKLKVEKSTPSALFQLLCFSELASTRISSEIAVSAAKALAKEGWKTPRKMAESTWRERTDALNASGYARYDESTSRMLGENCDYLLETYGGDLRKLREAAEGDVKQLQKLLKEFKGIGDTGASIFLREVQAAWDEVYPYVDKKAAQSADKLGLSTDAKALASLVDKQDFPRLIAALIRSGLAKDHEEILDAAG